MEKSKLTNVRDSRFQFMSLKIATKIMKIFDMCLINNAAEMFAIC